VTSGQAVTLGSALQSFRLFMRCVTAWPFPQKDGLHGDRELPSQVANALPEVARRESDRIRQPKPRPPKAQPNYTRHVGLNVCVSGERPGWERAQP
jgi:hypothetical protein